MISIRKANLADAIKIAEFQVSMALETENIKLDHTIVNNGVKAVFKDLNKGVYYVAEDENILISSLLTTYEWSDWRNKTILWIQSVYVIPDYRNKGIFKMMYLYLKEIVENSDKYAGIRLYVDKSNKIAQAVYEKIGMNGNHYSTFEWMKAN